MIGEFYKVTNTSVEPCTMTWNYALLENDDKLIYDEYQSSEDYRGVSEEDISMRSKVAASVKMRPFFQSFGKDVQVKIFDKVQEGERAVSQARYEWRFCIGPNIKKLIESKNLLNARQICEKWEIKWGRDDDVRTLGKKLFDKFGDNVRVLTQSQWLESGLQNREKKEIKMRLRPGETQARIVTEGYLEAFPMAHAEAEAYLLDKKEVLEQGVENKKEEVEIVGNQGFKGMDRGELKEELEKRGIEFNKKAKNQEFIKLLEDDEGES